MRTINTILIVFLLTILIQSQQNQQLQITDSSENFTEFNTQYDQKQFQQKNQRNSIDINYQHLQNYHFMISQQQNVQDFIISVDVDHQIKGIIDVYWQQNNVFVESKYGQGEQVLLTVLQNYRIIILSGKFCHAFGFRFEAKVGNKYILRFSKKGRNKLIIMSLENYLKQGRTRESLNSSHVNMHEQKSRQIKNKIKTYMAVVQTNSIINQQIALSLQKNTQLYMIYQIIQIIFVLAATITQIYLIRNLLSSSSII